MTTRNKIWAILAVGFLAVGGMATVMAKPDDAKAHGQERREAAKEKMEAMREHMKDVRDKVKEACKDAEANSTLEKRCEVAKDGIKARRAAVALLMAIHAHERILERVEKRMERVNATLAQGNLTANQTVELQERLVKLEERHEKVEAKIEALKAKLEALKQKWSEVKSHMKDRAAAGDDDADPAPAAPAA